MKKLFALLMALSLALSCVAFAAVEKLPAEGFVIPEEINTEATEEALTEAGVSEIEFDPNTEYDYYTVVDYTIEDIQADLVCTVSAKADFTEFYVECNFYGDDQMTHTFYLQDEGMLDIVEDKTGFMSGTTPAVLAKAMEQNLWIPIEK